MDRAIGYALAWWNDAEDSLGDVFCAVLGTVNNLAARGAYLAIINFNSRLQMVDAAASAIRLDDDLLAQWNTLRKQAGKKSAIRNRLTHFSRSSATNDDGEQIAYLTPNMWEGKPYFDAITGKGTRYTWPEVMKFGQSFGQLSAKLHVLSREIELRIQARPPQFPPSTRAPRPPDDAPPA